MKTLFANVLALLILGGFYLMVFGSSTTTATSNYSIEQCNIDLAKYEEEVVKPAVEFKFESPQSDLDRLISAMIMVESNNNDGAYNRRENAVGCLQIRPVMLNDCNRILELNGLDYRYSLSDRWDREKSIEMFYVIYNHYNPSGSLEQVARVWNGGPSGMKKWSTIKYWNRVKKHI